MGSETDEISEELFDSFLQIYQKHLKIINERICFDSVDSLYQKLLKISLSTGGSYKDSLKWLKNKKVTAISKNNTSHKI